MKRPRGRPSKQQQDCQILESPGSEVKRPRGRPSKLQQDCQVLESPGSEVKRPRGRPVKQSIVSPLLLDSIHYHLISSTPVDNIWGVMHVWSGD